jgi:hypothetical protein
MLWRKPDAILVRCETSNEDPDNYRFEADIMRLLDRSITILHSDEADWPMTNPIVPACDFLCHLAEMEPA